MRSWQGPLTRIAAAPGWLSGTDEPTENRKWQTPTDVWCEHAGRGQRLRPAVCGDGFSGAAHKLNHGTSYEDRTNQIANGKSVPVPSSPAGDRTENASAETNRRPQQRQLRPGKFPGRSLSLRPGDQKNTTSRRDRVPIARRFKTPGYFRMPFGTNFQSQPIRQ